MASPIAGIPRRGDILHVEKSSNHPIMEIEGLIDETCLGLQENREQWRQNNFFSA
jgi:hypothetical protein